MDWEGSRESTNVEDLRGQPMAGGGGGVPFGAGGGLGIGTVVIVLVISYFTGINPSVLLGGAQMVQGARGGYSAPAPSQARATAQGGAKDRTTKLVRSVLGETEDVWSQILPQQTGVKYVPATLVLFSGATSSGCGTAQSAMGPFYCPEDKKVYLDTSFFHDMETKYGGGGDFPDAYVVAHEIGHHVQDLLGILGKANDQEQQVSKTQANAISVRIELMADCLAGVFAAHARNWHVNQSDIQQAIATAQAIGDDRLQTAARGYAVPDSFTHGSSAQRVQWLTTGLKSGDVKSCDTFAQ
ncbi:MAG: neutral zinc metallopeptidase [Hyphomicrobiales bacterium]|nr:neutral zinc metallopeptidase [Hyphomicrobiales bacterium]